MRVLITGVRGFCGRHLARYASAQGATVVGLSRERAADLENVQAIGVDLRDAAALRDVVAKGFDWVFHLAFAGAPADRIGEAMIMTAIRGTENLLEAIQACAARPRLVLVSSAAVYGWASRHGRLTETVTPEPMTVYATLKHAQELLASSYRTAFGLSLVTVRPFNSVGPGERGAYVTGALAAQIVARERGDTRGPIHAGYLGSYRDFVDVRDVVRACWLAAEQGQDGAVYNICTGRATQVSEVAAMLQQHATTAVEIIGEPRPGAFDVPYHCGDPTALHQRTGWTPTIALDQSLRDVLSDLRGAARPCLN
ncbi:MAG TPA: NAD-dependent epimerase/dehydratase family protein [Candidatus Kryptonia bacterium]|nr:NAD-dependent epimerase/dehydratase family protein [Candidatus Kryptonia bacterium]